MGKLFFLKSTRPVIAPQPWKLGAGAMMLSLAVVAGIMVMISAAPASFCQATQDGMGSDLSSFTPSYVVPPVKSVLTVPEALVDIPTYTGHAKYLSGSKCERETGVSCIERWITKENRDQILEWYQNSLANTGWKVQRDSICSVSGRKDKGQSVQVIVNQLPSTDGYNCELVLQVFHRKTN